MFRPSQWLVALYVYVDVSRDRVRDLSNSLGSAAMIR